MKKITVMLSFIMMVMLVGMTGVSAKEVIEGGSNTIYGTISKDNSTSNGVTTEIYYITKTNSAGYVALTFKPVANVSKITFSGTGSAFEVVGTPAQNSDGGITVILKTKSGSAINGTETEAVTIMATLVDPSANCRVTVIPEGTNCAPVGNAYFDKSGKVVSESEYNATCKDASTTTPETPDVPNPQTGSYVPYIAVGAGLIAIAGVYFYSKKSNKMYRI